MFGKIILFLIAWSLLKKVVKAIRPEEARLDSGKRKGKRGRQDELEQGAGVEPDGPARDMIPVDRADPLAAEVLPGSRPGTCRDCAAIYSLPGDFPTSLARCDACGGIVEVGPMVKLVLDEEDVPADPARIGGGLVAPAEAKGPAAPAEANRSAAPAEAKESAAPAQAKDTPALEEPPVECCPACGLALEDGTPTGSLCAACSLLAASGSSTDGAGASTAPPTLDRAHGGGPTEMPPEVPTPSVLPAPNAPAPTPAGSGPMDAAASAAASSLEEAPGKEEAPAGALDASDALDPAACQDAGEVLALLGDRDRTGVAVREAFEGTHQGSLLSVEGTVLRIESYGHDGHFDRRKGPRITLETGVEGVRAVVLLPEGAQAPERGAAVVAHGRACGHDPYMRSLFLMDGGIATH